MFGPWTRVGAVEVDSLDCRMYSFRTCHPRWIDFSCRPVPPEPRRGKEDLPGTLPGTLIRDFGGGYAAGMIEALHRKQAVCLHGVRLLAEEIPVTVQNACVDRHLDP